MTNELSLEESINLLSEIIAESVEVSVWGRDRSNSSPVATLSGAAMIATADFDLPRVLRGSTEAIILRVGPQPGNYVSIWPNRFVGGRPLRDPLGIEVDTRDGVVRVQRMRRPWV